METKVFKWSIIISEYWKKISSIFWCYSQCNGYRHDTFFKWNRIINIVSDFLKSRAYTWSNKQNQVPALWLFADFHGVNIPTRANFKQPTCRRTWS